MNDGYYKRNTINIARVSDTMLQKCTSELKIINEFGEHMETFQAKKSGMHSTIRFILRNSWSPR